MEEEFLLLTNAVYKLLEYFPDSEPLKHRIKDRALMIFDSVAKKSLEDSELKEHVDAITGYLWLAKTQGFIGATNYLIISSRYEKLIKGSPKEVIPTTPIVQVVKAKVAVAPVLKPKGIAKKGNDRQEAILAYLAQNQKGQVVDFQKVLSGVTKRTIRRDLDELLAKVKIKREGEFNEVFYTLA